MRCAALVLFLTLPTTPDVIPPGHKGVTHELVMQWAEDLGEHSFVAYPVRGFHGHHVIVQGEPFGFSGKYGTRIYAVPAGAALPESRDAWQAVTWPASDIPVGEISTVAASHPLARVETQLRATKVTVDAVLIERLTERRFTGDGQELGGFDWMPLVLIAGAGIVLLLLLSRRRRPVVDPTPA